MRVRDQLSVCTTESKTTAFQHNSEDVHEPASLVICPIVGDALVRSLHAL